MLPQYISLKNKIPKKIINCIIFKLLFPMKWRLICRFTKLERGCDFKSFSFIDGNFKEILDMHLDLNK